jgi:hypothetical protein
MVIALLFEDDATEAFILSIAIRLLADSSPAIRSFDAEFTFVWRLHDRDASESIGDGPIVACLACIPRCDHPL